MFVSKESFLAISATGPEQVEIPDVGTVYVRGMSAGERDAFGGASLKNPHTNFSARLAAASVCDEQGVLIFGPDDVVGLSARPCYILDPITKAALRLNKMREEDVEDIRKNSESGTS